MTDSYKDEEELLHILDKEEEHVQLLLIPAAHRSKKHGGGFSFLWDSWMS